MQNSLSVSYKVKLTYHIIQQFYCQFFNPEKVKIYAQRLAYDIHSNFIHNGQKLETTCHKLNRVPSRCICWSPNTPGWLYLGDRAFMKVIKAKWDHKNRDLIKYHCAPTRSESHQGSTCTKERPCEDTVIRWPICRPSWEASEEA